MTDPTPATHSCVAEAPIIGKLVGFVGMWTFWLTPLIHLIKKVDIHWIYLPLLKGILHGEICKIKCISYDGFPMGRLYILPIHEWLIFMVQVNIQSWLINFYESRLVIVFCIPWSWWICVMLKLCESILNMPILSSLMSACWCLQKIHKKAITTISEVLLWCTYPPGNEETYPTKPGFSRKIIDSKLPSIQGYVRSSPGGFSHQWPSHPTVLLFELVFQLCDLSIPCIYVLLQTVLGSDFRKKKKKIRMGIRDSSSVTWCGGC